MAGVGADDGEALEQAVAFLAAAEDVAVAPA
jgi:hypothetical protein